MFSVQRRSLLVALAATVVGPVKSQDRKPIDVGVLVNGSAGAPLAEVVRKILADSFAALGYVLGRTLTLKFAYAEGKLERLPALAKDLVTTGVDVILSLGGPASRAAADATQTIPVVFSIVTDPVALGLVRSMQSPGANVTGVTSLDRDQAHAQMKLLKEAAPQVKRIAILSDADIPGADAGGLAPIDQDNLKAAGSAGLDARVVKLKGPVPDLDRTFAELAQNGTDAIVALEVPVALSHQMRIAKLAASHRMMSLFPGGTANAGAVLSYGTTVADTWKAMPAIADRIFRGASPSQIPVETVTRRELTVNLGVAKAIGLELPANVTQRADRRIE